MFESNRSYTNFKAMSANDITNFVWKNNTTRLNEDNMNALSDKVVEISCSLLNSDGKGVISEVNNFNKLLYGDKSIESLINKVAANSYYFLGYDYNDVAFKTYSDNDKDKPLKFSGTPSYVLTYFNKPWENIDGDGSTSSLLSLVSKYAYDDTFDTNSYWTANDPYSNTEITTVSTNRAVRKYQYGAVAKLNFFNDVLTDHHKAIKNIGTIYQRDRISYYRGYEPAVIDEDGSSVSTPIVTHSIVACANDSGAYFDISALDGVNFNVGTDKTPLLTLSPSTKAAGAAVNGTATFDSDVTVKGAASVNGNLVVNESDGSRLFLVHRKSGQVDAGAQFVPPVVFEKSCRIDEQLLVQGSAELYQDLKVGNVFWKDSSNTMRQDPVFSVVANTDTNMAERTVKAYKLEVLVQGDSDTSAVQMATLKNEIDMVMGTQDDSIDTLTLHGLHNAIVWKEM